MHFYVNKKRAKFHISDCVRISNNKKTSQNVMLLMMNYEQELQEIKKKNKESNKLFAKWNGYNHSFNSQINTTVVI